MAKDEKSEHNIIRNPPPLPNEGKGDYERVKNSGREKSPVIDIEMSEGLKKIADNIVKSQPEDKSDRIKKANPVMVTEFSEDAVKQLGLKKKEDAETKPDEKKKEKDKDWLVNLFKAAIPLLAIGGGLLGSLKSMFAGGPLQGISNLMAKVFVVLGDSLIKKLPGAGFIGKILTNVGGFFTKILPSFFGKGGIFPRILSTIKGVFTKIFGKGGAIVGTILGKSGFAGAKGGLNLMKVLGKGFVKRLPIIGSLISLGSAFKRFKGSDPLGGLIDIGAAIAYMFPGIGTAIGIALDLLNAGSDIYEVKNDKVTGKFGAIKGMFGDFFDFIGGKIGDIITKGIDWVVNMLYDSTDIPAPLINKALGMIGLGGWKRSEEEVQYAKNLKKIERAKENMGTGRKRRGKFDRERKETISKLEQENQDLAFKAGKISKEDYLLQELDEMRLMKDFSLKQKQRKKLKDIGFSDDELRETYQELLKATKEQNELLKEQSQSRGGVTAVSNSSNIANTTISYNSEGGPKIRGGRRNDIQTRYAMGH